MIELDPMAVVAASSGLVVAIVGIVEAVKRAFGMASRFAPLLSIALGVVAVGLLEGWTGMGVFQGVVAGLAASGLYSGGKATLGIKK